MFNSQCSILIRSGRRIANCSPMQDKIALVRPPSVRIRIDHWELNIGRIPVPHSAKLFLLYPALRATSTRWRGIVILY
jgi:hypothetical protein